MFIAPKQRVEQTGLTLLEVVVGMAILALMAGAIYGIVIGSVESTTTLAQIQTEDRRVESFLERARTALAYLPAGASVELKIIEAEPLRQELIIRGVGDAFVWGDHGWWDKSVVTLAPQRWPEDRVLSGKPQNAALAAVKYSLAMTVPDFYRVDRDGEPFPDSLVHSRQGNQFVQPDAQGRFWVDLLPEVEGVEWRFYDPTKKIWLEQSPAARPPLVEIRLRLPGRKTPLRILYETA